MRIVYCPAGADPMTIARTANTQKSHGRLRDMWIVPAIVVFAVIGVTVGPLKGCLPEKTVVEAQPTAELVPQRELAPTQEAIACTLPTNEKLCNGCMNGVAYADRFVTYRCNNGELAEIKSITTTAVLPAP